MRHKVGTTGFTFKEYTRTSPEPLPVPQALARPTPMQYTQTTIQSQTHLGCAPPHASNHTRSLELSAQTTCLRQNIILIMPPKHTQQGHRHTQAGPRTGHRTQLTHRHNNSCISTHRQSFHEHETPCTAIMPCEGATHGVFWRCPAMRRDAQPNGTTRATGCNCYGRHSLRTPVARKQHVATHRPYKPGDSTRNSDQQSQAVHASSTGTRVQYHNRLRLPAPTSPR
jgi:hypothetical protein